MLEQRALDDMGEHVTYEWTNHERLCTALKNFTCCLRHSWIVEPPQGENSPSSAAPIMAARVRRRTVAARTVPQVMRHGVARFCVLSPKKLQFHYANLDKTKEIAEAVQRVLSEAAFGTLIFFEVPHDHAPDEDVARLVDTARNK